MAYAPSNDVSVAGRGERSRSKRICVTLNAATFRALQHRGADEGSSISNMASYLLERTLLDPPLSSH